MAARAGVLAALPRWRRKGPGGNPCKLDGEQLARLRAALDPGPAVYGWAEDQRWTLARVATLIERLSGVSPTRCAGPRSCCTAWATQPAGSRAPRRRAQRGRHHRMAEGDLGEGTRLAAATGAWICFEDEAGQALARRKARTWARRRHTPVIRSPATARPPVGRGHGLPEGRPARPALLPPARPPQAQGRAPVSLGEADYAGLIAAAHRTLDAPPSSWSGTT